MSLTLASQALPAGQVVELVQGDITLEQVDAIVNAANNALQHGGGVAAAISRKGGPTIQAESNAWVRQHGSVPHAEPAYTSGGSLPCQYVIHAVGPVWGEGDEDAKLTAAVRGSLVRADGLGLKSLAMPAISTGIFRFPKARAANILLKAIEGYCGENPVSSLKRIRIVVFDQPTCDVFRDVWEQWAQALRP
jgi:O-acetyl-ADP-ribose deacetylase (regulator of RNase III)